MNLSSVLSVELWLDHEETKEIMEQQDEHFRVTHASVSDENDENEVVSSEGSDYNEKDVVSDKGTEEEDEDEEKEDRETSYNPFALLGNE